VANMILPVIPSVVPEFKPEYVSRQNLHDSTFADHFDRQLAQEKLQGKDKFGIPSKEEKLERGNSEKINNGSVIARELNQVLANELPYSNATQQDQDVIKEPDQTVAGILSQFMQDLQKTVEKKHGPGEWVAVLPDSNAAQQDQDVIKAPDQTVAGVLSQFMQDLQITAEKKHGPGEWVAVLPDHSLLQQVADKAGMGEADMSLLLQQLEVQRGELNLTDFFSVLDQHFKTVMEVPAVIVPETELPFLETLLSKMGLSLEDITALSSKAVKNEGTLDLSIFLEGFQQITDGDNYQNTGFQNVQLSDWELEQLQTLLAQAGVKQGKLTELFPERYLENISGGQKKEFFLSFERLQDLLSKAIADIKQNMPQPDLPGFLKELDNVFSHTQFTDASVGWAPVVQHSLTAVFREMQDVVEHTRKRFIEEMGLENKGVEEELLSSQQSMLEGKTGTLAEYFSHTPSDTDFNEFAQTPFLNEVVSNLSPFQAVSDSLPDSQLINSAQNSHVVARSPQQLQAQVFQQISAAVMHGIRSEEHHLVLRLYPQELGEVKVDMHVKNEQISITFNMENSRVKEMLESNMEQFRENMEQKGFSLGECNVSVGQQDDFGNEWQRFMMSGKEEIHKNEILEDIPDDVLSLRGNSLQQDGREGALNLFV
jgi:flagellar hook-length control protein FliK